MKADVPVRKRNTGALLRDRNFGPYICARIVSSSGIWVSNIAAAVLMFELTRSAFMVGAVSMMQFLGPLVLAVWAGALSDRVNRRKLLMIGRAISGSAIGALAVLLALRGTADLEPVVLLAAVLVVGLGFALSSPAGHALVPALVRDEELEQALALNAAGPSIARTVGPATGAALLALGGPALAFAVAALSQWSFVAVLLFIRARRTQERQERRPPILGGLRYLTTDRIAGLLVLGVAVIAVGADPAITLTPSLADELGGGSELVGALVTAFGVGAVALTFSVNMVRNHLNLRMMGVVGFWVIAGGLLIAASSVNGLSAIAGFLVAGVGFMMANVALVTRIQRRIPDELRGRVMALWGVAFLGSRPLAALVNGSVADLFSVRVGLVTAAVLTVGGSLLARVSYASKATAPGVAAPQQGGE